MSLFDQKFTGGGGGFCTPVPSPGGYATEIIKKVMTTLTDVIFGSILSIL